MEAVMPRYWLKGRAEVEIDVYVMADSLDDATEKARKGEWDDVHVEDPEPEYISHLEYEDDGQPNPYDPDAGWL